MKSIKNTGRAGRRVSVLTAALLAVGAIAASSASAGGFSGQASTSLQAEATTSITLQAGTKSVSTAPVSLSKGGTLTVSYSGSWTWPWAEKLACPSGTVGGGVRLHGLSSGTQLSVRFTKPDGTTVASASVTASSSGTASVLVCVTK